MPPEQRESGDEHRRAHTAKGGWMKPRWCIARESRETRHPCSLRSRFVSRGAGVARPAAASGHGLAPAGRPVAARPPPALVCASLLRRSPSPSTVRRRGHAVALLPRTPRPGLRARAFARSLAAGPPPSRVRCALRVACALARGARVCPSGGCSRTGELLARAGSEAAPRLLQDAERTPARSPTRCRPRAPGVQSIPVTVLGTLPR